MVGSGSSVDDVEAAEVLEGTRRESADDSLDVLSLCSCGHNLRPCLTQETQHQILVVYPLIAGVPYMTC
jgi:hypothetical protein